MIFLRMQLPIIALACLLLPCAAFCPPECTCTRERGLHSVLCQQGGLTGPLSLFNMSLETEVVRITAPEDNTNLLTMSPVFSPYKRLKEIYITRSNIPQLGQHFFYGLNRLDVLDLSLNNISQPLDHNFRGLSRLHELILDDNRIHSLPSGTFRYLRELKVLSIQRNRISELTPSVFMEIGKLRVLKMSGNYLKHLNPLVFNDVQELKTLECRSCGLSRVDPPVYELLDDLEQLDLGDNELAAISSTELKPLTNLRLLKLDGNRIATLKSSVFFNQNELQRLNLNRNRIETIDADTFTNLANLTELDLSHNKFDATTNFLLPIAPSLQILLLNGNRLKIAALNRLLAPLTKLRALDLEECGLTDLEDASLPDSLAVLNLAKNHLTGFPPHLVPTQELDLSNNRLRGLHEGVMSRMDRLSGLKLAGNPLSCDLCHIIPLLERSNRSEGVAQLRCAQPYSAKGKRLFQLRRAELPWCTVAGYATSDADFFLLGDDGRVGLIAAGSSVCLLLVGVALAAAGVLWYSRRHAARYYTHEDKMGGGSSDLFFDGNQSPLFGDERELSFKFPLDGAKRVSVATIDDEMKKKELCIT